jgi:DNA-binding LacI/PurR family transcriptional regulator/DNA-binding transcriptional regulator YhcF (GntR family)
MSNNQFSSLTDQVTELLRNGMLEGRWRGTLPGRDRLAEELGCSHWTIEAALKRLSKQGMVISQGTGKRRQIVLTTDPAKPKSLRLKILLYEAWDRQADYLLNLVSRLHDEGHIAEFSSKTMEELGMNPERIARYVNKIEADAWIVIAGPLDVLEWFATQPIPAFGIFGRLSNVSLPSFAVNKIDAVRELVDHLVEHGHKRIVMIVREEWRKPKLGRLQQSFIERLNQNGIQTSTYNLPDWGNSPEELHRAINSLFQHTPPTALIIAQPQLFLAVIQHLACLNISAPKDISLACTDISSNFSWFVPNVTHIQWDSRPLIKRVIKWARNVSRKKDDFQKSVYNARLVHGGMIGPVPSSRKK